MPDRRKLHGRRHGRRLRPGLQQLVERLLPELRVTLPEAGEALALDRLFGQRPEALWLEIGFGNGEHLAWQAEQHREISFLGAEVFVNGVAALLRAIAERQLANLRIYQGDGRDLLDVLAPASLGRVFILFPDPWPKTRHHRRRILQQASLDRLAELMCDGAELRIASDHDGYLRWILERACRHPAFDWQAEGPADWRLRPSDWPATRYERKALAEGRRPAYLRFRRRPRRTPLPGRLAGSPEARLGS